LNEVRRESNLMESTTSGENLATSGQTPRDDAKGRLTAEESVRLTDHITSLTRGGLPLGPGLVALAEELPPGRFRQSLLDLSATLARGVPLDSALKEQKDRIPPHLRGLVTAGMRSGQLGDILGRFSGYMSIGTELSRKLWLSLAYPIVSILLALILFVFVNVVLVSQFETMFKDFGIPLPKITIAMLIFAHAFQTGWPAFVLVGILVLAAWLGSELFLGAAARRSLAASIPVLGGVWRYTSWAEFCHLLALLLESHLPLPEALRLTGEGVQDARLNRACEVMANDIEQGGSLSSAMISRNEFPKGLPRLLKWAGDSNATAEILHMAGEMFEARARGHATFAGTVMAVLAVISVLWGLITVVGGLMLPLITLISRLSG
jgi:general secretion pathway protein F